MDFDRIVCEDALNLSKIISHESTDLSIVVPPCKKLKQDREKFADFVLQVLEQITIVAKPGGVCCIILGDDMNQDSQTMDVSGTYVMGKIQDYCEYSKKWIIADQLTWVKSSEEGVNAVGEKVGDFIGISYENTPFDTVMILVKNGQDIEFDDRLKKVEKLRLSEKKKAEIFSGVWCIQKTSEKGFKDSLPKDLLIRLMMVFSNENDLVVDPFAGDGITALTAKYLKRHYFCIDKNSNKVRKSQKRLESHFTD